MKIATYNVNGIRAALEKGLLDWITQQNLDVVCVQETKAHPGSVPLLLIEGLGYRHVWHSAKRKGYSGVATFSRIEPTLVQRGIGLDRFDCEGRVLRTDFEAWTLVNIYVPSGAASELRHRFKMDFLESFRTWIEVLQKTRSRILVVGDFNIAHQPIDVHHPERQRQKSGFRDDERAWLSGWLDCGFIDAFRHRHPADHGYTWWSRQNGMREADSGWRIDYQMVSQASAGRLVSIQRKPDAVHSDHCPVVLELDNDRKSRPTLT